MRTRFANPAILVCLLLAAAPVAADDSYWTMRLNFVGVDHSTATTDVDVSGDSVALASGFGVGVGLGWEYRFGRRVGLDLGWMAAVEEDLEISVVAGGGTGVDAGTLVMVPFTLGANVHLTPDAAVDLYVGGLVGYVFYSSVDVDINVGGGNDVAVSVGVDDDVAPGVNLGLDVPMGRRGWVFNLEATYLDTSLDASDFGGGASSTLDYDPLILGIGFGFRF